MNSQKRLIGLMALVVLMVAAVLAASAVLAAPEYVTTVAINDPTTDNPLYVNMAMSPTVPIDYSIWSNEPGDVGKIEFWVGSVVITTLYDVPFNGGVYNDIEILDLSVLPLVGNQTYDAKVCANANDQSTPVCSEWFNAIVYDKDAPDWICAGGPHCQLLTYPNLDIQTFEVGTIETITWRDECVEDEYMGDTPVYLAYSPNGEFGDYSVIAGGTENDGEYDWLVNVPPSNDGWLQIIIMDLAGNFITDTKPIPTVWAIDYTPPVFDWGDVTLSPLYFPTIEGTSDGFISDTLTVEAFAEDAGSGIREVGFYAGTSGCDEPFISTAVYTDYSGDLGLYSVTTDTVGAPPAGWGLADGDMAYFKVVVENGVGARTSACMGWYYVDLSGPDQFYIDDPADGDWINGTYDVDVYAKDGLPTGAGLIDFVAFQWWDDDNTTWEPIGIDPHNAHSGYWDYDWNTVGLSANECFTTQLFAFGADAMGHMASDMITVTIDNTAPGVLDTTLTQPAAGEVWQYGRPITITWDFTDVAECGLDNTPITLYYGSEPGIADDWSDVDDWYTIVDPTENDGEYEWTPTETDVVFPDRDIWIWLEACDQAGNCASDYAGPFTIWTMDPSLPAVMWDPAPAEIGLFDNDFNILSAQAWDDQSGIMNVKFYWKWPSEGDLSYRFIDMDGVEYVTEAIDPLPYWEIFWDAMDDVGLDDDCWDPAPAQGFCDGHLIDLKVVATNGVGMTAFDIKEDVPIVSYLTPQVPMLGRPIDGSIVSGQDFLFFGWAFDAGAGEGVETEWFYFDDTMFDLIEGGFTPKWEHIGMGIKGEYAELEPNGCSIEVGNGEFYMYVDTLERCSTEQGGYGMINDIDGDYKFIMCAINPNDADFYACTEGNDPYDREFSVYGTPPVLTLDNSMESFNIWLQDGMDLEQGMDAGWNNVSVPFYSDIDITEAMYEYIALGAVEGVHKFAGDTKEWFGWSPLGAEFDKLNDGVGYWVQVEFEEPVLEQGHPPFEWADYQITVRGTLGPEPGMAPHEYWTYSGWNNMGFTPENLYEEPLFPFEGIENWNDGYFFPDWDYLDGCMYLFDYLDQSPLFYDVRATYIFDPWMDMYETVEIGGLLCPGWGFWLALEGGGVIYP